MIDTETTSNIGHADATEAEKEVGWYNRAARGHCNMMLPNGKICPKRSLWYFNGCLIWFGRRN